MAKNMRCLGIDLNRLRRQIMTDHWYWIGTAGARCEHVFRELFECVSYADHIPGIVVLYCVLFYIL